MVGVVGVFRASFCSIKERRERSGKLREYARMTPTTPTTPTTAALPPAALASRGARRLAGTRLVVASART